MWFNDVAEFTEKITSQRLGGDNIDHSGEGIHDTDPKISEIHHIDCRTDLIPKVQFPLRDWAILEGLVRRNLLSPPKVIFRIMVGLQLRHKGGFIYTGQNI